MNGKERKAVGGSAREEAIKEWGRRTLFLIIPAVLLVFVGPRVELLGLSVGIILLSLPVKKGGIWSLLPLIGAAFAAVGFGFRVRFITDPGGGFFYLDWISIPFTFLWILIFVGAREALRRALPRRSTQFAIDIILVLNALFLSMISPQTRAVPIAFYLPAACLFLLLIEAAGALRRRPIRVEHLVISFALALFGISGAMKGAVSIAILWPLAVIGVPLFATAHAHLVHGNADHFPLPRWFVAHRYSPAAFLLTTILLTSAFGAAAVSIAQGEGIYGLIPVAVIPGLWALHRGRPRLRALLSSPAIEGERRNIFGVGFHSLTLDEATWRVEQLMKNSDRARIVVTPNSTSLLKAGKDPILSDAYLQADLVLPDGIGIVWASRLLGSPLSTRVTGVDLSERLLARASTVGTRVFLLGGRPGVAARAAERLKARFPGLRISGTHHGYFTDDKAMIKRIAFTESELILVGMGVPRQERFMLEARESLPGAVMIGVGGALDLFAGDCRRAPRRWQRLGLEWLYRLLHDPRRIKEAVLIPQFIVRALAARALLSLSQLSAQES